MSNAAARLGFNTLSYVEISEMDGLGIAALSSSMLNVPLECSEVDEMRTVASLSCLCCSLSHLTTLFVKNKDYPNIYTHTYTDSHIYDQLFYVVRTFGNVGSGTYLWECRQWYVPLGM